MGVEGETQPLLALLDNNHREHIRPQLRDEPTSLGGSQSPKRKQNSPAGVVPLWPKLACASLHWAWFSPWASSQNAESATEGWTRA
jgi:hypothetical protein